MARRAGRAEGVRVESSVKLRLSGTRCAAFISSSNSAVDIKPTELQPKRIPHPACRLPPDASLPQTMWSHPPSFSITFLQPGHFFQSALLDGAFEEGSGRELVVDGG